MFFLLRLLIHMVAILIIAYLLPNVIRVDGLLAALVAAFLLGIVNAVIRPILVIFTFPLTIFDIGTLPARHQWVDAVFGGSSSEGILCQWLLGSSLWLHLNQYRELDTFQAFTPS